MPDEPRPFDVRTNAEWQRIGFNAESSPAFQIDASKVPERFRHLVPYAERWGIDCDVRRGDYFDKQPASEINDFYQAVNPHWEALNAWINEGDVTGAKLPFSFMLKAYCEAAPPLLPRNECLYSGRRSETVRPYHAADASQPVIHCPLTQVIIRPHKTGHF